MEELKIEYIDIKEIKPYKRNARKHQDYDISAIKASIETFGFNDPIGIWSDDNIIVEGHGRLEAAKRIGMKEVPCIRLDNLTDVQRREYALVHNKSAELSLWDNELLNFELDEIEQVDDIDMSKFGFDRADNEEQEKDNPYTDKVNIPQYEPKGIRVGLDELIDKRKYEELLGEINESNITQEEKEFLRLAAARHIVFDYKKIAEYYAVAEIEIQELMENSALVIIDKDDAIANGYAIFKNSIEDIVFEDDGDD